MEGLLAVRGPSTGGYQMKTTRCVRPFSLVASLAITAISAFGQSDTGTLLGAVVDPSQAVVAGATVTLRNTATGKITSTQTGKDGVFQFPSTLVGSYSLQVTAPSF